MKLFNLSPKTLIAVAALIILLALGLILPQCHAAPLDPPYTQLSAGEAIVRGSTQVLDLTFVEPATVLRNASWQESLTVIGESSFKGQHVPNNFALRTLFLDGFGRLDVGLGVSWMQNPNPYNGSSINFNLQLDWRFLHGATLTYTHMSNAGSRPPNLGRDLLLIGWRFH